MLGAVLTIASLGLLGATPSSAEARGWRTTSYYYAPYSFYVPEPYYAPSVSSFYYPADYTTYNTAVYVSTSYYSPPVVYSSYYTVPTVTYYPRRAVYSPGYVYYYRPVVVFP
jgi:hypothetical protein